MISAIQAEWVIAKQARFVKDWKRMCKSAEETAESRKIRQQELADEVEALTADLSQVREQLASQEYVLGEKDEELVAKDSELTSWAAEATQMQQEIEWEREEKIRT